MLVDINGLAIPSDAVLRQVNQGPQTNLKVAEGFMRGSLLVVVKSVGRRGGKCFVGITSFHPGRSDKQVDVRIGFYGKGAGKWTLRQQGRTGNA